MVSSSMLWLVASASFAFALRPRAARQTSLAEGELLDPTGWTPKPTDAPRLLSYLSRRQSGEEAGDYSVFVGKDRTCGFVSGLSESVYACPTSQSCLLFPTAASHGVVACCNDNSCGVRTACLASAQYNEGRCGEECRSNTFTLKCTASTAGFCGTIKFSDPEIEDYFCDSTSVNAPILAMTAYTGDTDVTRFSTYRPRGNTPNTNEATSVTTTDIAETTSSISQSTSSESSLSSSTGPILPPPTCTGDCPGNEAPDDDDNDNGNGEGSNNDDDGNNNNDGDSGDDDGDDSDSPGKGTIIGGSFGGILGLVILAVIGFFLRRWKKKRDAAVDGILDDTEERGLPGSGAAAGVGGAREIKPMANATTNEIPALYNKDMPHPTYRSPMDFPYASVAHNLDSAAVSRVASATVQPLAPVKDASIPSAGQQQQQHAVASRDLPPAAAAPERTASFNKCHAGDACNNTFWPIHMR